MRISSTTLVLVTLLSFPYISYAKAVFAHYMLGTITEAHAQQDIDDAIAMGLDGFALNIGDPSDSFVEDSLTYLFSHAETTTFKLFISMDVYALGDACYNAGIKCTGPFEYYGVLSGHLASSAWYMGPNGKPMISTFSSGGFSASNWTDWKATFDNEMYFIPDFDETAGYYTAATDWYDYWGDVVDGLLSWESAWPARIAGLGGDFPGDIAPDKVVLAGAKSHDKGYMMPLSALQYKNSYGTNVYRPGDETLAVRMYLILEMETPPDFVLVVTWNDGPESHYIGNIWPEQNTDAEPNLYATQVAAPHSGWRPIIQSFITAYKNGDPPSAMLPPSDDGNVVGAMWYKPILQSAACPVDGSNFTKQPDGFSNGTDSISWAVVIPVSLNGYQVKIYSNNVLLQTTTLNLGMNYGIVAGVEAGPQRMEFWTATAETAYMALGSRCVSSGCPDGFYNMNLEVVPLAEVSDVDFTSCSTEILAWPTLHSFVALGDSYSAGIGASCGWVTDQFDENQKCLKCEGAYPYQIVSSGNEMLNAQVWHVGCTAAKMTDVVSPGQDREAQVTYMSTVSSQAGWGTLSIGGNDVGFGSIVTHCLVTTLFGDCDKEMTDAETKIESAAFIDDLVSTYETVLSNAATSDFTLVITGYAQFFNADTTACNTEYFMYGKYLTQDLRLRMNNMVLGLNDVIIYAVARVQQRMAQLDSLQRIVYQDWDGIFEDYRFCEESPKDWRTDAWFLTVNGDDTLADGSTVSTASGAVTGQSLIDVSAIDTSTCVAAYEDTEEWDFQIMCEWAINLANGVEPAQDITPLAYPARVLQFMHPKTLAHVVLGELIYDTWRDGF